MSKGRFVYNENTLQYEAVKVPIKQKLLRVFGFLSAVLFSSVFIFVLSYFYLSSPKEQALEREIQQMEYVVSSLSSDYENISGKLQELQAKDADVHRVIFGLDPIDDGVWNGGVGGHDQYEHLNNFGETGNLLKAALTKADKIKRKLSLQTESLDTIQSLALIREEKLASVPSIKPIQETKLKRNIRYLSGFGWRIHPIHKVKKFHAGMDFTAPRGTAIQATGKGKVKRVEKRKSGYGYNVIIDHGYGYETLYAHMATIDVKKGEKLIKGQKIGTVGSTGTSTAPHLHYEVHLNGKAINPIDYCLDGLTPVEYQSLVSRASQENQSFD